MWSLVNYLQTWQPSGDAVCLKDEEMEPITANIHAIGHTLCGVMNQEGTDPNPTGTISALRLKMENLSAVLEKIKTISSRFKPQNLEEAQALNKEVQRPLVEIQTVINSLTQGESSPEKELCEISNRLVESNEQLYAHLERMKDLQKQHFLFRVPILGGFFKTIFSYFVDLDQREIKKLENRFQIINQEWINEASSPLDSENKFEEKLDKSLSLQLKLHALMKAGALFGEKAETLHLDLKNLDKTITQTISKIHQEHESFYEKSKPIRLLMRQYSLTEAQAQKAVEHLNKISCIPLESKEGVQLKFKKGEQTYLFDPLKAAKNSYENSPYHEDLSGVISCTDLVSKETNPVIVFSTNEHLVNFIEFVKIIDVDSGDKLRKCYEKLCNLKKYLKEECGLPYDLLDACGLNSAAVVYPWAFGDCRRDDTTFRAFVMGKTAVISRKLSPREQKPLPMFPTKIGKLPEEYEQRLGHKPCHGPYGYYGGGIGGSKYAPSLPLSYAITLSISNQWCINDEQPFYWPAFFPLGLHLVKTPDDTRDQEYWEKNFVFDQIVKS